MSKRNSFIVAIVILMLAFIVGCGAGGGASIGGGESINCVQVSTAELTLKWDPPTTNEDGSPLTDLEGYIIYYGGSADTFIESVNVGPATSYTMTPSAPGTWYFAITAYNQSGAESRYSPIVCANAT